MRKILATLLTCLLLGGSWSCAVAGEKKVPPASEKQEDVQEETSGSAGKEEEEEDISAEKAEEDADSGEAEEREDDEPAQGASILRFAEITTKSGTLNLRKKASATAKITAKLPNHSKVRVLGESGEWSHVAFGAKTGYVKTSYLTPVDDIPYETLSPGDKGDAVMDLKKELRKLGYLKKEEVNKRFDLALENALRKLQMLNGVELSAEITPELQALIYWGNLRTNKSGYSGTATDKDSGLTVALFCWDSGGKLYEEDQAVKVNINFVAQAMGGTPPYTVTVSKTLNAEDGAEYGDTVASPFGFVYKADCDGVYLWAVAEDADGNKVTAKARFRYTLPSRYTIDPNAID